VSEQLCSDIPPQAVRNPDSVLDGTAPDPPPPVPVVLGGALTPEPGRAGLDAAAAALHDVTEGLCGAAGMVAARRRDAAARQAAALAASLRDDGRNASPGVPGEARGEAGPRDTGTAESQGASGAAARARAVLAGGRTADEALARLRTLHVSSPSSFAAATSSLLGPPRRDMVLAVAAAAAEAKATVAGLRTHAKRVGATARLWAAVGSARVFGVGGASVSASAMAAALVAVVSDPDILTMADALEAAESARLPREAATPGLLARAEALAPSLDTEAADPRITAQLASALRTSPDGRVYLGPAP